MHDYICICPKYEKERKLLYSQVTEIYPEFRNLDNIDRFMMLNTGEYQRYTAIYVYNAFNLRKKINVSVIAM